MAERSRACLLLRSHCTRASALYPLLRRAARNRAGAQSPEWAGLNLISTIGAYLIGVSVAVFLWNFFHSIVLGNGKPAGDDPWEADTLEWATTSPPPEFNFETMPPIRSERPVFDLHHPAASRPGAS